MEECETTASRASAAGSEPTGDHSTRERNHSNMATGRRKQRAFDPWRDRRPAVERILDALNEGLSLRKAAKVAGIHVATACRWQNQSQDVDRQFHYMADLGRKLRFARKPYSKPTVLTHPDCPRCGRPVEVRAVNYVLRFWRCSDWPKCFWASWRPRVRGDCFCGGPLLWSHSRNSVVCTRCGVRTRVRTSGHYIGGRFQNY
jgi:hypothetical protein